MIKINRNKVLEILSQRVWPLIRIFVKKAKRCRNCIISEKCMPLTDGLCEECRKGNVKVEVESGERGDLKAKFDEVINSSIREKGFDAALLLSGGKDSAYILYRMKRDYPKLKIQCIAVDNGFMSPFAMESIKYVSKKLDTELLVCNDRIPDFYKSFREAFLNLKGRGSYSVVDYADGDMIFKTGHSIAKERGIPMVIAGLSWVQLQKIFNTDGFELNVFDVKTVCPLAVWRTDEQEIRKVVRELKLLPPGSDSPVVSNNDLIATMCSIDIMNLGYCSFEPEFAQLIREGKTDKYIWRNIFEFVEFTTNVGLANSDIKRTLGRLNLTLEEVIAKDAK